MSNQSPIAVLAQEIAKALLPLKEAISSSEAFSAFMNELGWDITEIPTPLQDLSSGLILLEESLESVLDEDEVGISDIDELRSTIITVFNGIDAIRTAPDSLIPPILRDDNFKEEFPRQLIDFLIINYLIDHQPIVADFLGTLGIIRVDYEEPSGNRPEYMSMKIATEDIPKVFDDPVILLENSFGWRTDEFDAAELFRNLDDLLVEMRAYVFIEIPEDEVAELLEEGVEVEEDNPNRRILRASFFDFEEDEAILTAGIGFFALPLTGTKKPGFAILPYATESFEQRIEIAPNLFFSLNSNLNIQRGVGILVRPDEPFQVITGLDDPSSATAADGMIRCRLKNEDKSGDPIILLGSADNSRLELKALSVEAGLYLDAQNNKDLYVEIELEEGRLLITPGEGDGFLQKILPEDGIGARFDLALGWSSERGVYFRGSSALEVNIPTHFEFSGIEVRSVTVAVRPTDGDIPIDLGASVSARLGPVQAIVENFGLKATFSFPDDNSGNLGPLDVDIGFKPPDGVGLSIDAQGIKGGGFLEIDRPNHRYAGNLQLEFQGTIDVTAIGLITTELPGGKEGFSLLILISAEFQPIQLGMGFTLNGVGGLLGYNRTMVIDVLREGVRDNSLNGILFPEDPVANAMAIISDLQAPFPPHDGQFVIGPMAKIGYGTPTLISLELGLVIELPDPFRIAILGVLKAMLPEEEAALIEIQVNFLGTIDFEKGKLTFDASLFDSRLLTFDLSGDMALRLFWKGEPQFLLSVGGFHPAFEPPPLDLPTLRRLTLQLLKGNNPRLRLETYFAVTSNTVQFGARLELYAESGKFNVYGFLAFDVLFQFSPFYFIASIGAMLALRVGSSTLASISLSLSLEGTTPWKAKGTAKLKLFWFLTVKVRFSKTWGDRRDTLLEDVAVLGRVVAALQDKSNWQSTLPGQRNLLVSLKEIAPVADQVVVHPFGGLTVSQKVVPLNVRINKFGNAKPSDFNEFSITGHQAGGAPIDSGDITTFKDYFAPAQFFKKSDAEKLSADSFVKYDAGFSLGTSEQLESSHYVKREVEYKLSYRDSQREIRFPIFAGLLAPVASLFNLFTKNRAIARSPLSHATNRKSALAPEAIEVKQEGYAIVNINNLTMADGTTVVASEAEAFDLLNRLREQQPSLSRKLQVVPAFDLNLAEAA